MSWKRDVRTIHETVVKKWPAWGDEDKRFLALAMSGEVGEALNEIKKEWRGDFPTGAALACFRARLAGEFADIRIYFELLAQAYGIELDAECERKVPGLLRRWPEAALKVKAGK